MSVLFAPPLPRFSPSQATAIKTAELAVHNAAMEIHDEIRENLPAKIRDNSYPVAILGFTSAIGRLFAAAPNQEAVPIPIMGMTEQIIMEYRYWSDKRLLLH